MVASLARGRGAGLIGLALVLLRVIVFPPTCGIVLPPPGLVFVLELVLGFCSRAALGHGMVFELYRLHACVGVRSSRLALGFQRPVGFVRWCAAVMLP